MPCIKCGQPTAGMPLCDKCQAEVMAAEEKRKGRISAIFTLVVIAVIIAAAVYLKSLSII